jgi:hypothetical protein
VLAGLRWRLVAWRWRRLPALDLIRWPRIPLAAWIGLGLVALALASAAYQLARKPTEILGLLAPRSAKSPSDTWRAYRGSFEDCSTPAIRPELLAALAQAESSGDPLARARWRFRWTANPLELWGPPSSAVGLLQMTDATYQRARHLCIRGHAVAREGAWYDPRTCFLNTLYVRTWPSHAIEMTAAWLDLTTAEILSRPGVGPPSPAQREALAAAVHLCGPQRAAAFAARGFRVRPGERCGGHDLRAYLARVRALEEVFAMARAAGG